MILKRNAGAFWTKEPSPTMRDLRGLTGTPSGDMYAVGSNATVVCYNEGTWTAGTSAVLNGSGLNAVAAAPAGNPLYMTSVFGEIFSLNSGTYARLYQSNVLDLRGIAVTPLASPPSAWARAAPS